MYVLFTDTDTDLTPVEAKHFGYHLISMPYSIGDKTVFPYEDFEVFDYKAFYNSLRHGVMPQTSGLSPQKYIDYFEPFFKEGKDVLYVHFSEVMSGTFAALKIAEDELKEKYPERTLHKIDTKGITIGSLNIVK
ncbi:MAG: DegV family protein, partial [Clostridia bacterium]|nr:DegV family protein [Clostridia bacterium]